MIAARKKLEADTIMQSERTQRLLASSPETLDSMVRSISNAFERCCAFSDPMLLVAFKGNPVEVERVLTKACKKVLSAPILTDEYTWFRQYVFPSSIWFMRTQDGKVMTRGCSSSPRR